MDRAKSFLSLSAYALYVHFALQLVAGGLLATVYRANATTAHATTATLHHWPWAFLQGFHYWGSAIMIVHSVLHLAGVTWAGWYNGPQLRGYLAALALAGLSLGFQISGNALPWDRHGVQTASVEGAIANRVPIAGGAVSRMMMGGQGVSDHTLPLWYDAHLVLLPIVLLVALAIGVGIPRKSGAKWALAIPAGLALLLAVFVASPFGSTATPSDYTHFDAKPSWYTVPMHGLLVWGDRLVPGGGWIGAALLPALFAAALLVLPLLKRPKPILGRGLIVGFGLVGLVAAITSGGEVAPLVGTRDPIVRKDAVAGAVREPQDKVLAAKGRTLFAEQGCEGCHGKDGLQGTSGPSLKDLWKEHPEASFYERYVKNPASVDAGSTMPAYPQLKDEELHAVAEFLRYAR